MTLQKRFLIIFEKIKKNCLQKILSCYNSSTRSVKTMELFLGSSMAEHSAVNRRVVGSSPTRGAILKKKANCLLFLLFIFCRIIGSSKFLHSVKICLRKSHSVELLHGTCWVTS